MQITTIGFDIAKNVFQIHGIDAAEKVVIRKQLRRGQVLKFFAALPPCLVGTEACATAHYWARELTKLGPGLAVNSLSSRSCVAESEIATASDAFQAAHGQLFCWSGSQTQGRLSI